MNRTVYALIVFANTFNLLDYATTVYSVCCLEFQETNRIVRVLIESNPTLYTLLKIGLIYLLSLAFYLIVKDNLNEPLLKSIRRGCFIGYTILVFILALASTLNIVQIVFRCDVSNVLLLIAKVIPILSVS